MASFEKTLEELLTLAKERRAALVFSWSGYAWQASLRAQNHAIKYQKDRDKALEELLEKVSKKDSSSQPLAGWDVVELSNLLKKFPLTNATRVSFTADFRKGSNGRVFKCSVHFKGNGGAAIWDWKEASALSPVAQHAVAETLQKMQAQIPAFATSS